MGHHLRGGPAVARVREKRDRAARSCARALRVSRAGTTHHARGHRRAAGVRKTALYHYFPDKESILYACHQECCGAGPISRGRSSGDRRSGSGSSSRSSAVDEDTSRVPARLRGHRALGERQHDVVAARTATSGAAPHHRTGIEDGEFRRRTPRLPSSPSSAPSTGSPGGTGRRLAPRRRLGAALPIISWEVDLR